MSIIACNSGSGEAGFAFVLYAALARGGFGACACASSSSSSEMTIPLLTRAVLLDSVRLDDDDDDDDGFASAPALSSSESESFRAGFFSAGGLAVDLGGLGSDLKVNFDAVEDSPGSTLTLSVSSCAGLGADFALLKSSFPEGFGFGFGGSFLISSLTSFGSDLMMTGLESSAFEGAFDRPGSLFLEVEGAAEDLIFAEGRVAWISVRF